MQIQSVSIYYSYIFYDIYIYIHFLQNNRSSKKSTTSLNDFISYAMLWHFVSFCNMKLFLVKWDFVLFLLKEEVCKEDFHERKKSMHHTKTDIFFFGNCNIKGFTASI